MRWHTIPLLTASTLFLAATGRGGDTKKPDNLDGTWRAVSSVVDGKKHDEAVLKTAKMIIKGETFTLHLGQATVKGTFTTDPTKTPRTIDAKFEDGKDKVSIMLAIYRLDGDTLTVCGAPPGKPRPKEFASKAGTGDELVVWKRDGK